MRIKESLMKEWDKRLEKHELVEITDQTRSFHLKEKGQWLMSTVITFTKGGIVLSGDLVPGDNGCISARPYGIDWFSSELSPDYLAEKFLRKKFIPELAASEIEDPQGYVMEYLRKKYEHKPDELVKITEQIQEILIELKHGDMSAEGLYRSFEELNLGINIFEDGCPGFCYPPHEVAILSSIQKRFAKMYLLEKEKACLAEKNPAKQTLVAKILASCRRVLTSR